MATSIIPPFRRLRQDGKFEASLDHIVKLCLKKNGKKKPQKYLLRKASALETQLKEREHVTTRRQALCCQVETHQEEALPFRMCELGAAIA